jgi:hypothetical protein
MTTIRTGSGFVSSAELTGRPQPRGGEAGAFGFVVAVRGAFGSAAGLRFITLGRPERGRRVGSLAAAASRSSSACRRRAPIGQPRGDCCS